MKTHSNYAHAVSPEDNASAFAMCNFFKWVPTQYCTLSFDVCSASFIMGNLNCRTPKRTTSSWYLYYMYVHMYYISTSTDRSKSLQNSPFKRFFRHHILSSLLYFLEKCYLHFFLPSSSLSSPKSYWSFNFDVDFIILFKKNFLLINSGNIFCSKTQLLRVWNPSLYFQHFFV